MPRRDPEFAEKLRDRVGKWDTSWRQNRTNYYEWVHFIMGGQWKEDESKLLKDYKKTPLIFNKLGALANHMMGEQMQNTPNLQVYPASQVQQQTAEVRGALVKDITLSSDSKTVYQTAFGQAIIGGFGAFRIGTEYENNRSFNQVIRQYEIRDPCRCYWDITAKNRCKTDGMYAGFRERMSRKMARSIWGKKIEAQIQPSYVTNDMAMAFADDDSITIFYDYERIYDTTTIYKLSDDKNTIVDEDEFDELEKIDIDGKKMIIFNGEPVTVLDERDVPQYKIKYRMVAGDFILEEQDFASQQLPIVFVDQNSYQDEKGLMITRSFFEDVKDAQRFLNYIATTSAYLLKVSRYDQYIVSRANIKNPDTQEIWRDPATMQGALVYDESPSGSKPEKQTPSELPQSMITQYERCLIDIQTGTGMYNAQLGQQGNEISGDAVDARTERGSYNTYVPFNSLNRAIVCAGEIINEMIPVVYDVQRQIMLTLPDRENALVHLNQPTSPYEGTPLLNDMSQGEYKIRLLPGPSFEGQKKEAVQSMQMLLQADPSLFTLIGDLYCENLPLSNSIELRNRVRTLIDPAVIDAGKTGKPLPPKPPQPNPELLMVQLKQAELQQKQQQAVMENELKQKDLMLKQAEIQRKALETHQNMSKEFEHIEMQKQEAAAKLQETLLRYQAEAQKNETNLQMTHADNLVKVLTHHPKENKEPKPNNQG